MTVRRFQVEDERLELQTEFGYFEFIRDKEESFDLKVPIAETILVDKGQIMRWLFTEKASKAVKKKTIKKLNKESITQRFLRMLISAVESTHNIKYTGSFIKFYEEITNYSVLANHEYSNYSETRNHTFIQAINSIKCFQIKAFNSDEIANFSTVYRNLHDPNLLSQVSLIQNYLEVSYFNPIICKYTRHSLSHAGRFTLLKEKPASQFEQKMRDREDKNELIALSNYLGKERIQQLTYTFVKFLEKKEKFVINELHVNFLRTKDSDHLISSAEGLKYSYLPEVKPIGKKIPKEPKKFKSKHYERVSTNAVCFGEFCHFVIPPFFKNLKKNQKVEEINTKLVPKENKFTERGKNYELPNSLPVFVVKRAWDNKLYVDIVLKAYSIFPKHFDSARYIEKGNQLLLYTPKPDKFRNLTEDIYYSERNVCNNCFIIYSLIQSFLSNIDENSLNCVCLTSQKH